MMLWFFHMLWLILVILLFFSILRRVYYFGIRDSGREQVPQTNQNSDSVDGQQFYIFTVYNSRLQHDNSVRNNSPELPTESNEAHLPKYEEVIKSPGLYQKPPSYDQI
ncbi:uncharacterized protein LOC129775274 isoform X1 [Toxorhynchites rutilus septentrionalis]|uniref:uncharacterized protein LOC129775274 isoform X1 n=1 Tax=Toxorhynchites rutilus septentrionalis TaxID=329112 RepID=UPI00247932CB|nr:uncharacterized protein LOC129775274 isoform X1 [Toxorhynchites rutilus septentrionalis]